MVHVIIGNFVNNAYIVYCELLKDLGSSMDSRTYRRCIACAVIKNLRRRKSAPFTTPTAKFKKAKSGNGDFSTNHIIEKREKKQRCKLCTSKKVASRTNSKCAILTFTFAASMKETAFKCITTISSLAFVLQSFLYAIFGGSPYAPIKLFGVERY